jgi:hypothetical protein
MSPDEKLKAAIEVLKIVVWPGCLIWLVWYLRDEVKRVAARLIKLGLSGAEFAPPLEQVPSPPTTGVSPTPSDAQSASQGAGGTRLQQFIANTKQFIAGDQLEPAVRTVRADLMAKIGDNPADQIEALMYTVASLNIQVTHERNYNIMYGSQLRLLHLMTSAFGITRDDAKTFFEEAKSTWPDFYRSVTFEQWIGFLQQSGLCTVDPNGNYVLTPYGRGFLKYIVDRHLPPRPF